MTRPTFCPISYQMPIFTRHALKEAIAFNNNQLFDEPENIDQTSPIRGGIPFQSINNIMEGRGKNLFHEEHHEDEYNQEDNTKIPFDNIEPKEKDITDALNNKSFMKMMQVILEREKETIFLDLAK